MVITHKDCQIMALHMANLNTMKMLCHQTTIVADYKKFMMAISSNNVKRLCALVKVALQQKLGICSTLDCFNRAANGLYWPKTFEEKEML